MMTNMPTRTEANVATETGKCRHFSFGQKVLKCSTFGSGHFAMLASESSKSWKGFSNRMDEAFR